MNATSSVVAPTQQAQREAVTPVLVVWYHILDRDFIRELEPQLQLLRLRLNKQFQFHFHESGDPPSAPVFPEELHYPEDMKKRRQQEYEKDLQRYNVKLENTIRLLSTESVLILPCISPKFMIDFWNICEQKEQLQATLHAVTSHIFPIIIRPTTGISLRSLASYAEGPEREAACAAVAARIEATLLHYYPAAKETKEAAPFLLLKAPYEPESHPNTHKKRFIIF
jgi:hypothetical protein